MRIELLLLLIKHYANNPANFILPQYIKSELNKPNNHQLQGKKHNYYIVNARANETACGFTAQGLFAAIGDASIEPNRMLYVRDEISTHYDFEQLKQSIIATGSNTIPIGTNSSDFLVYQFTINGDVYQKHEEGSQNSHSIDHIFSIIQYKHAMGEFRYCMLQSYAGEQSMLQFINASEFNNTLVMDEYEMKHFLNGLQKLVNAKVIDDDIADFYQKYFKITTKYKSYNLCRQVTPILAQNGRPSDIKIDARPLFLNVQWKKSNMQTVCNNLQTYITDAQQQDAPQIIEIPENGDNQLLQPFSTLMRESAQQNPLNPINFVFVQPFTGELISKTIDKAQLPILEALQPKKMTDIKYPASKDDTLRQFKILINEAQKVSEMQDIFDIACVCVNQHQNTRWDSFWGIQNTASLREIITIIRRKALNILFTNAPSEENIQERSTYFISASKMSLFNKHKNNFKITGAFSRTHALKVIEDEIDRLTNLQRSPEVKLINQ